MEAQDPFPVRDVNTGWVTDEDPAPIAQGSFTAILGLTPNQQAVAAALDRVAAQLANKTGLLAEFNFLDTQPLSTLPGNLDKIVPEELTAIFPTP